MKILVPARMVPDLVEELTVGPDGASLDTQWLRLVLNEFADHAVEQAILMKERHGAEVVVIAPEAEGLEDALYTAAAKGADRLLRLSGDLQALNAHALARALLPVLQEEKPDLILTGVQAHDDLDGQLGPLLAGLLDLPYVGYVSGIRGEDGRVVVRKEYPDGLRAELTVSLPAVIGVQAADQPLRYVAFSRVRQAMQSASIQDLPVVDLDRSGGPQVTRMRLPEPARRAEMLTGSRDEVAARVVEIVRAQAAR